MKQQNKQAFTLVELIVVITILAILGTIAFISLEGYSSKARDSKRISDIQNIKTSLEFYSLNTGKYPLADNASEATYSGSTMWTQGTIGDNIVTNLSRNLRKKPLDPLTETEYTYSVTEPQKEYELLAIYESDLLGYNNLLNQTQASDKLYPKIDGTYNGVAVKTSKYIIPTPSIINAEIPVDNEIVLDSTTIQSQITTGGDNIIDSKTNTSTTGELDINFRTYEIPTNGEIDKNTLSTLIQETYSGSTDLNSGIYEVITETTDSDKLVELVENTVLSTKTFTVSETNNTVVTYDDCDLNGTPVAHTESITAYETESVSYGNTCNSEQRTCTDGNLEGSFTFTGCTVDGATGTFNLSETSVYDGASVTIINDCSESPTSYTSSNTSVATISGNTITTVGVGTTNITPVEGACGDNTAKTLTVNPNNCLAGTKAGVETTYTYGAVNHGLTTIGTGEKTLDHGTQDYTATITCNNGDTLISNEVAGVATCEEGYYGDTCNICNFTYQYSQNNKNTIIGNIDNYVGCEINDYPGTSIPGSGVYIAGITNNNIDIMVVAKEDIPEIKKWKTTRTSTPSTTSLVDGLANTNAMAAVSILAHPAGKSCRDIGINWYLPAKDELNIIYLNNSSLGSFEGRYWSSSERYSTGYSWYQVIENSASNGYQSSYYNDGYHDVLCVSRF